MARAWWLAAAGLLAVGVASLARPALGEHAPAIPLALDLRASKVRVGSWSEYGYRRQAFSVTQRFALTERQGKRLGLEVSVRGGGDGKALAGLDRVILKLETDGDPTAREGRRLVLQAGNRPPLTVTPGAPLAPDVRFEKLRPDSFVGEETIVVPAGTYRTRHHRWTADGSLVEAWVAPEAQPLGLVRMRTAPVSSGAAVAWSLELARLGQGAVSEIRGPVQAGSGRAQEPQGQQ
jgi:hypothetical protein